MIRRALLVDVETTGLDPAKDAVIEIGAILYSVVNQTSLQSFSSLIRSVRINEAYQINRIRPAALGEMMDDDIGLGETDATFARMIRQADVLVAHNAKFDRSFLPTLGLALTDPDWQGKPWLCSKDDFTWPQQDRPGMSLVSLALAHGIGVASAHRALTDCALIAELFSRMTDLPAMFERAMRPKKTYQSLQPFDKNQLAKDHGFGWNADRKIWMRTLAVDDVAALPFKVREVAP